MSAKKYIVSESLEGARLDRVVTELLPGSGLRLRRRLCDEGRVEVNGRKARPGYKVLGGQEITLRMKGASVPMDTCDVEVVRKDDLFAAVYKPGGVHSASIDGKEEPCVENMLPDVFPGLSPVLLNRLDYLTSGLLLVALQPEAKSLYRAFESAGKIKKFYGAVVHGRLDGWVTIKKALDTANRKKTKVLAEDSTDPCRWTDVEAVSHDHEADTTEVRCLIAKGARHQIRAHLASLGHAIVGDPLYGRGGAGGLRLHHQKIEFPGFMAEVDAPW